MLRPALGLLLAATLVAAEPPTTAPAILPAYVAQAAKLAPAGTPRPALIAALHSFVRDQIPEIPTKYG